MKLLFVLAVAAILPAEAPATAAAAMIVVAAENFYGDVARQIGGPQVTVTSILSSPDQDPHLFEASPSVARAVSAAQIVIYNGLGYDPWITRLLAATPRSKRTAIAVADLVGAKAGENPHIWYDPRTMPALAEALASALEKADPTHGAEYRRRLFGFEQSMKPVEAKIAALRARLSGISVTATEPVFGPMLEALGMRVRNRRFQLSVMNNTEPSASDVAAFEEDLKNHRVKMLLYNSQASDPIARRMKRLAEASHIPIVGASETEPPGVNYQAWMLSELNAVERALPK